MKNILILILSLLFWLQPCLAFSRDSLSREEKSVQKFFKTQLRYANRMNYDKYIKTYDSTYSNSDGFNLDIYSKLVRDIWKTYDNIKYDIEIENIALSSDKAIVDVVETSYAELGVISAKYTGELKSVANTTYCLVRDNKTWKVLSDTVKDETTTMLYGDAKDLKINLTVPKEINANVDYSAVLEFVPPKDTMAIASIASDIVEYPQKPTEEVFRVLPEDNILERLFTSNDKNANEYIIASIGLINLKQSLTPSGFGYCIKRVNVIANQEDRANVENE